MQQYNQGVSYCGKGCCCFCICPNLPCVPCQAWLALAHGHFHGLYQDPPGTIWSLEISLSIWGMWSWRLHLVKGGWKAEPGNKGQALTISACFFCWTQSEITYNWCNSNGPNSRRLEGFSGASVNGWFWGAWALKSWDCPPMGWTHLLFICSDVLGSASCFVDL